MTTRLEIAGSGFEGRHLRRPRRAATTLAGRGKQLRCEPFRAAAALRWAGTRGCAPRLEPKSPARIGSA